MQDKKNRKIIVNKIQCDNCKAIIVSNSVHDYNTCSCGNVSVDGGHQYTSRSWKDGATYTEKTIYSDAPLKVIRQELKWGTYGKTGGAIDVAYVPICEMSDNHLSAIISKGMGADWIRKIMKRELAYRKKHNIVMPDRQIVCKLEKYEK